MVKNTLDCLSGALNYAVYSCKYIKYNPCEYVKVPKIPISADKQAHTDYICSKEDFAAILARFGPDTNFYLPLITDYHCGARLGESYGIILLHDVDFEAHTLTIRHQLSNKNGK